MKSHRKRMEERLAAEAPHGRQLSLALSVQRGVLVRLQAALARETSPARKASLQNEISNVQDVIRIREQELAEMLAIAESERVSSNPA